MAPRFTSRRSARGFRGRNPSAWQEPTATRGQVRETFPTPGGETHRPSAHTKSRGTLGLQLTQEPYPNAALAAQRGLHASNQASAIAPLVEKVVFQTTGASGQTDMPVNRGHRAPGS